MIHVIALVTALLHITPTVVLVKRPDAVATVLPDARTFVAREIHLSDADAHRLHETVDWSPEEGVVTFYTGRDGDRVTGALTFVRVDSPHGPVEVAVGFEPHGTIRKVVVTKATVETKPWVLEALRAGLTSSYEGIQAGSTPDGAAVVRNAVGKMPTYMAERVDLGVARALAAYGAFYR